MAALSNSRNTPEMADGGRIRVLPVEANTTFISAESVGAYNCPLPAERAGRTPPARVTTRNRARPRPIVKTRMPGIPTITRRGTTRCAIRRQAVVAERRRPLGSRPRRTLCADDSPR